MEFDGGIKVKRNDEAVWRVIDDEVVVLLPQERRLHALTGCGSRIWELIEGERVVSDVIQKICDEYDVEPQVADKEVREYINKLIAMKMLDVIPAVSGEVSQ